MCIAVAAGGAALGGSVIASQGAKKAAKAQARGDQAAIDEQRRQFDLTRQDFDPYRQVGTGALNQLAALYGIPQYTAPPQQYQPAQGSGGGLGGIRENLFGKPQVSAGFMGPASQNPSGAPPASGGMPDFSTFYNSPDYQFNWSEGLRGVENSAAARGGLYSGAALKALQERGAGIASQQYGNYTNRLAALAGIGQTATSQLAGYGAQTAGNVGSLLSNQGNARASGIAAGANAWGNTLGTLGGLGYDYFSNRRSPTQAMNYTGPRYGGYA